jgi:hypothetical protein
MEVLSTQLRDATAGYMPRGTENGCSNRNLCRNVCCSNIDSSPKREIIQMSISGPIGRGIVNTCSRILFSYEKERRTGTWCHTMSLEVIALSERTRHKRPGCDSTHRNIQKRQVHPDSWFPGRGGDRLLSVAFLLEMMGVLWDS